MSGVRHRPNLRTIITLTVLASGTLTRDPKSGTSASGTRWANTSIRCPTGQDKEGNATSAFISVLAFGDEADRLSRLAKGDAISTQGALKQTQYEKDGEIRHDLEIVAQAILSPYQVQKKRGERRPEAKDSNGRDVTAAYDRSTGKDSQDDYDDAISF